MSDRTIAGDDVDALVFDVQGTLLDFFGPVSRTLGAALGERGVPGDASALTNRWRRSFFEAADAVVRGAAPYRPTARIYRQALDALLDDVPGGERIDPATRDRVTASWTELEPWPDTVDGLRRLRGRFRLVALTNGGMAATIAMAARHDLGFHALLTSDLVGTFKPDARLYRLAIDGLGVPADRIAMVASHPYDLDAAASFGMRGVFVERPVEFGPDTPNEARAPRSAALSVGGCDQLADQLIGP